jgi:hypothetical protein
MTMALHDCMQRLRGMKSLQYDNMQSQGVKLTTSYLHRMCPRPCRRGPLMPVHRNSVHRACEASMRMQVGDCQDHQALLPGPGPRSWAAGRGLCFRGDPMSYPPGCRCRRWVSVVVAGPPSQGLGSPPALHTPRSRSGLHPATSCSPCSISPRCKTA